MAKLTIFKPDEYMRKDVSEGLYFLKGKPVDLGVCPKGPSVEIRFHLPGKRAIWYGDLELSLAHAEQLISEIDSILNELKPDRVIPEK